MSADYVAKPWRVGRRVGRTIYADDGAPDPNDGSLLIGVMDTQELAWHVMRVHNWWLDMKLLAEQKWGAEIDPGGGRVP